jgi:serine/threonine-protein kinase
MSRSPDVSLLQSVERRLPTGFSIQEQLGAGATSWVYRASRPLFEPPAPGGGADAPPVAPAAPAESLDGEQIVVKVMHPGTVTSDTVDRFLREMQILQKLEHPHIVPLLEPGEADGTLFFTMPYVCRSSLRDRLNRESPLPLALALVIARDVADALGHAHGRGVVHRDVKPENILLRDGRAYLIDFGFASAPSITSDDATARDAKLSIGTPDYISPEQLTGKRTEDWRSDFFSLACVLQEMLTGRAPFASDTPRATMQRRLSGAPDDLRALRPDVPEAVVSLIRKNLSMSPNDRSATASFLRMALDAALEGLEAA